MIYTVHSGITIGSRRVTVDCLGDYMFDFQGLEEGGGGTDHWRFLSPRENLRKALFNELGKIAI